MKAPVKQTVSPASSAITREVVAPDPDHDVDNDSQHQAGPRAPRREIGQILPVAGAAQGTWETWMAHAIPPTTGSSLE